MQAVGIFDGVFSLQIFMLVKFLQMKIIKITYIQNSNSKTNHVNFINYTITYSSFRLL